MIDEIYKINSYTILSIANSKNFLTFNFLYYSKANLYLCSSCYSPLKYL